MSKPSATIFIVDDDDAIRISLRRSLVLRDYRVETFVSARAFLAAYTDGGIGCLLLDQGMPGMTGLELQDHLRASNYNLPVIFITGHGGVPESVQAMKQGAIDFLEKPFHQSVLLERIETALQLAHQEHEARIRTRQLHNRFGRLTARELEIVKMMVADPSAISSKELGRRLDISPRTVDHHRARILEKLDVHSVVELIDLARGVDIFDLVPGG